MLVVSFILLFKALLLLKIVTMNSLFQPDHAKQLIERLESLEEHSTPQWGKMNAAQMLEHCALALDVNAGKVEEKEPSFMVKLMKPLIKSAVFGPKPYRKNSPTNPQFKVSNAVEFQDAKQHFVDSFNYFTHPENKEVILSVPSKLFGLLTEEQKGFAQFKHINYHFNQFGL